MHIILFLFFLALCAAIWFWNDSLRAREYMTETCRAACARKGLQFLDETVSLARIRLCRQPGGLLLQRRFNFEFSSDGNNRHPGHAVLIGQQLKELEINLPDEYVPDGQQWNSVSVTAGESQKRLH